MSWLNLLLWMIMMSMVSCEFMPERLRLIDSNKTNKSFFIRGNLPINKKKQFQINQLLGNLTQITGLKRYKLIVISLMNFLTPKETRNRYIQQKFFQKNKKLAQYRNRVVMGSFLDPTHMPDWTASILSSVGKLIDFDQIQGLIEEIHNQVHGSKKNTIVYMHCQAGLDRTGYVAGAYKMKYFDESLKEVMQANLHVLGSHRNYMVFNAQNGLQWYCYGLGRSQNECQISE